MLQRSELKIGDEVMFGRANGEKSIGKIVKLNLKTAAIECPPRGSKGSTKWRVDYRLLTRPDGSGSHPIKRTDEPIEYSPFTTIENYIMMAIIQCYCDLSPENLSCDGEAPRHHVISRRNKLNRQLKGLFAALGRQVDESAAYAWDESKRKYQEKRKIELAELV